MECVIHEAASDDDESEDEIEYVQTREGEAERDWREIERAAASGETLAPETRDALALGVMRAAARAARSQSPEESELVLRLWARRTATALRAFGVDDDGVVVSPSTKSPAPGRPGASFHWLNALAREFEWTPILLAMDNDARRAFITDGLRAARNATRAFTATLCGAETIPCRGARPSPRRSVASAPDADASDDALLTFVRHASEHDAEWTTERATSAIVRRFLDAAASRLETFRVRDRASPSVGATSRGHVRRRSRTSVHRDGDRRRASKRRE